MNFIVEKYKSIRGKWFSKTPKGKLLFGLKVSDIVLSLVGLKLHSDNKRYFWTYSSGVLIIIYYILALYTVYIYKAENNTLESLKCFCVFGVVTSVNYNRFFFTYLSIVFLLLFLILFFLTYSQLFVIMEHAFPMKDLKYMD